MTSRTCNRRRRPAASICALALLALGAAAAPCRAAEPAAEDEPRGYYVLQSARGAAPVPETILTNPWVRGIVLRRKWKDVNPAPEKFDWTYLDGEIARIKKHGKLVQLLVFTGVESPDWVYEKGARRLSFFDGRKGFGRFTMPVPWDEKMLAAYEAFLSALGERYNSEPAVTLVHIGGPTRLSLEFHMPREVTALPDWTPQRLTAAWLRSVRAASAAFPDKNLALNVSPAVQSNDGVAAAVVAGASEILGPRLALQHDALSAKTSERYSIHALIVANGSQGKRIGFEMLCESRLPRFGGSLERAIEIARAAKARYVNVYAADVPLLAAPY